MVIITLKLICLIHGEEIYYVHYMTTSQHKNPCPGSQDIHNIGGPFLGYRYYTLSLSDLSLGVERKILKKIIIYFLNKLYGHTLAQDPLPQG